MAVRPEELAGVANVDLSGETALVTGSSTGIGREAALALSRLGADVVVHGLPGEARAVRDEIRAAGGTAECYTADFSDLDAVRSFADEVRSNHGTIDILANNAGASFAEGKLTDTGVEATLTVNYLAPFLLTHRLFPAMREDGRIVMTASAAHQAELDPDSFDDLSDYDTFSAYMRSKLAVILFTRELARQLDGRTANCFHPGFVPGTGIWRESPRVVGAIMSALSALPDRLTRLIGDTPASAAATLVYLAASPDVADTTGGYFVDCEERELSETARDDDLARALWERTETLVDLKDAYRLDPGGRVHERAE